MELNIGTLTHNKKILNLVTYKLAQFKRALSFVNYDTLGSNLACFT